MFLKYFGVRIMSTFLTLVDPCGPSSCPKCHLEEVRMQRSFPVGFITSPKRTLWHHSYQQILYTTKICIPSCDHIITFHNRRLAICSHVSLKLVSKYELDPVVFVFGNCCHIYLLYRKLVIMTLTSRIKPICIGNLQKYTEHQSKWIIDSFLIHWLLLTQISTEHSCL